MKHAYPLIMNIVLLIFWGCGALFLMDLGLWAKDAWFRDWAQRLSQEYEYAAFSIKAFARVHDGMIKGGLRA